MFYTIKYVAVLFKTLQIVNLLFAQNTLIIVNLKALFY